MPKKGKKGKKEDPEVVAARLAQEQAEAEARRRHDQEVADKAAWVQEQEDDFSRREAELEKWHDAFALSATTTRPGEEDDDVRLKPSQCLVLGARRTSGAAPRLMMTGPRTTASAR